MISGLPAASYRMNMAVKGYFLCPIYNTFTVAYERRRTHAESRGVRGTPQDRSCPCVDCGADIRPIGTRAS